ncbi:hypothetical protein H4R20_002628, partial [Coemansia guatemalensis]
PAQSAQSPTSDTSESTASSAPSPPLPPPSSSFAFPGVDGNLVAAPVSMQAGGGMRYGDVPHPPASVPRVPSVSATEPELVNGSEFDTSDTDTSYLQTPQEGLSDEVEEGSDESDSDSSNDNPSATCETARSSEPRGTYQDTDDHRSQSRATTVSSRQPTHVYIQPSIDIESAARYGEGYKHMHVDPNDDGSLEVAAPVDARAAADGFIPALIAATRRKREIQIVRFQNTVDKPEGAIPNLNEDVMCKPSKGKRQNQVSGAYSDMSVIAGSSRMANMRGHLDEGNSMMDTDERAVEADSDTSSTSEDGLDMVLDMAVSAMMESISASQTVMQIRCPQCPTDAPSISSQDWETHRDWHIARHLQEREMRHETVARQFQRAFNDTASAGASSKSTKPAAKRVKHDARSASSSKPRQQTITDAWK